MERQDGGNGMGKQLGKQGDNFEGGVFIGRLSFGLR